MNKFTEAVSKSLQIAKTVTTGLSSTNLLDMRDFGKAVFTVAGVAHTSSAVMTCTIYESTATTWNGAVAKAMTTTSFRATASASTVGGVLRIEVDEKDMDADNDYRYLGCYVDVDDDLATGVTAVVDRLRKDWEPV